MTISLGKASLALIAVLITPPNQPPVSAKMFGGRVQLAVTPAVFLAWRII